MKTKQLNKILIISLTFLLIIAALFTFSACKDKEFEPKEISIEQAQTLLDEAKTKMFSATTIYAETYEDGHLDSWCYANSELCYSEECTEDTQSYECYQNTLSENNHLWSEYCYDRTDGTGWHSISNEEYNSTISLLVYPNTEIAYAFEDTLANCVEMGINVSAKQTAENKYEIVLSMDNMSSKMILEDGYLVSILNDDEDSTIERKIQYNITKTVPSLPNIEWEER